MLLLAVFATETAIMEFFSPLFSRLDVISASLIDATILVLLYAFPLWHFVVQPLFGGSGDDRTAARIAPARLLTKVLAVLFIIEFLVMIILPRLPFSIGTRAGNLSDACLTVLLSAAPLWWLLFRPEMRKHHVSQAELSGTPIRVYVLLLSAIFVGDLLQQLVSPFVFTSGDRLSHRIADSVLTTLLIAPFLWLLVARPLRRVAHFERTRASTIHSRVLDAVVTVDSEGFIVSFNPAAERIFGYSAAEITGKRAARLVDDNQHLLDELLRTASFTNTDQVPDVYNEFPGRCRDGSSVPIEVSVSRVSLEDGQEFLMIMRDIGERKLTEQKLLDSFSLLATTLESTAEGILAVDRLGQVRAVNQKFLDMLCLPRHLVEGSTVEQVHLSIMNQVNDPSRYLSHFDEAVYSDPDRTVLDLIRFRDGRVFECYSQPQILETSVVGRVWSFRDITARTEAEDAVRESEARFRQVFEQTDDAIMFFKPGTCSIIDLNTTAEQMYGYTKNELKAVGLEGVTDPSGFARLGRAIGGIRGDDLLHLEKISIRRKDGSEIILSMRGKVMTLQGVAITYCTFRDVTERVRLEEEARYIQATLIQANKMTSLGLLVSGVAHEINNPNNFIMANSQLLSRAWEDALKILREYYEENGDFSLGGVSFSELDKRSPNLFAGINDGAYRINQIVNNLKSFARQDRVVAERHVDVNEVAASAISILHHELVKYTDNFHTELAQNLPTVKGNGQQLGQVIVNLLMNACQALPAKSHGVWLTTGFDPDAGTVTITVRDEGEGMTQHVSTRIMEPFFTTKLDRGGTGLGLSICLSIVKEHRGTLDFSSEAGKGTTFIVTIPAGDPAVRSGT